MRSVVRTLSIAVAVAALGFGAAKASAAPICVLQTARSCAAEQRVFQFDGSSSTTVNPPLAFSWSAACTLNGVPVSTGEAISGSSGELFRLHVAPAFGQEYLCRVSLTVTDSTLFPTECTMELTATSCELACTEVDTAAARQTLSASAITQRKIAVRAARLLHRLNGNDKKLRKTVAKARGLSRGARNLAESLPPVIRSCANQERCFSYSTSSILDAYRDEVRQIKELGLKTLKRASTLNRRRNRARINRELRLMENVSAEAVSTADALPQFMSLCTE